MDSAVYTFDCFCVDAGRRLLRGANDVPIALTPKVFDTLLYLVSHHGELIEKDELMSAIWADTIVEENNLNKNISTLRRVLGENRGEHRFIATVPGRGYKFVANVEVNKGGSPTADDSSHVASESNNGSMASRGALTVAAIGIILATLVLAGYIYLPGSRPAPEEASRRAIAILPFRPLVAENRDEAMELGMADTLISRLSSNNDVIIRPLSSVRNFGGMEQDAIAAGRALGVESVLDGNIQRWGDRIRVNVRLIKVSDGSSIWTSTFDERFTDILLVQDAIADRVAAALAFQFTSDTKVRFEKQYTKNSNAYGYYVRGRFNVLKSTEANIRKGIEFYERAIEADPNYALAYAGMADAYRTLASVGYAPAQEVCPKAGTMARKAIELDAEIAEPHIVLGWLGFLYERDWANAESTLKRAIQLSPNNSDAHRAYAHFLSNSGRHEEAFVEARKASDLSPFTLIALALESQFLFYGGRDDEAIAQARKVLDLDPDFWVAHNMLGRIYSRQGRFSEAIAELSTARSLSGGTEPMTQLGFVLARSGDESQAKAMIAELEALSNRTYVPAYNFAMVYHGLGDSENALRMLRQSFDAREIQLAFLKIDSRWDKLRAEPRFREIADGMNFPE